MLLGKLGRFRGNFSFFNVDEKTVFIASAYLVSLSSSVLWLQKIDIKNILQKKHVSAVITRFIGVRVGENLLKTRIFGVSTL